MKKRRALRPSFVVTAALIGCGGQVAEPSGPTAYGSNPPSNIVDSGSDVDAPTACPTTEPTLGAPCEGSLYCDYSRCTSTGGSGDAFACSGGVWTKSMPPSCNPPMLCPPTEPTPGTPCTSGGFGVCSYTDTCSEQPLGSGKDSFTCSLGRWKLVGDYALACPTLVPANGSSCRCGAHTTYATACTYCGPIYGGSGQGASCDPTTGTWTVSAVTCNPPPPPPDAGFEVGIGDAATD